MEFATVEASTGHIDAHQQMGHTVDENLVDFLQQLTREWKFREDRRRTESEEG